MQRSTVLTETSDAITDGGIVEREVETIRTREHVAATAVEEAPTAEMIARDVKLGYVETLPERMSNLGFVLRASVIGLLAVRFLLLASGANTSSGFAGFVVACSWLFAWPFANLFSDSALGPGIIEFSTLVAIPVYLLIFALLGRLYVALAPRLSSGVRRRSLATVAPSAQPSVETSSSEHVEATDEPSLRTEAEVPHTHRRRFRLVRPRSAL